MLRVNIGSTEAEIARCLPDVADGSALPDDYAVSNVHLAASATSLYLSRAFLHKKDGTRQDLIADVVR